ncbi:MAG: HAMP domain-containing sensor histidine kinase [Acidimicrobiales bacterium]|jgi:two-component system OmpR family sensor kinase
MSLRARLLVTIGVIALVALAIADVVTYSALQSFLYQRVDQQLASVRGRYEIPIDQGDTFPACFGGPGQPFPTPGPGGDDHSPGSGPSNAFQSVAVQLRTRAGHLVGTLDCPAYVNGSTFSPVIPATITGFQTAPDGTRVAYFDAPSTKAGGPTFRVQASTIAVGDLLIVAQPLGDTESTLHHLLVIELIVTAGAVLIALLGGFWLVQLGLKPLRDMETAAESIADGNLTERVPGENSSTEVGRLARTLNVMLSRIESAFSARVATEQRLRESDARLRRFVADASHELRTPIAAVSAYAELFGRGASEQKEDLERLMRGIVSETGRMERLVADLLLLARLDEGRPMEMQSVDLVALCAEAVSTARTVGPGWPITFTAPRPIEVTGDATGLRQVVDNLLGNVRAHTPEGTKTRVSVDADGSGAVVEVSDSGPGLAPDQVAHVFERFYRSDPSRSRLHGGAGLGLSIVSAIVAAHGGSASATSVLGQGSTFTVRLPSGVPVPDPDGASQPPPDTADAMPDGDRSGRPGSTANPQGAPTVDEDRPRTVGP